MVNISSLETTYGTLLLAANEQGLCRLALPTQQEHARFQEWVAHRTSSPLSLDGRGQEPALSLSKGRACRQVTSLQTGHESPLSLTLSHEERENKILAQAKKELCEYLTGARSQFTVPLALEGGTFFQQVWDGLIGIPYGRTMTYAALATALQRPRAFRAVGSACAKNPIPLIIPCHRAVGSNGSLTGFAGGLAMKEALLQMEGAMGG